MKPNEVRVSDSERLSCSSTKIFIDNGHGQFTAGKRSPDGEFREYHYNREIAKRIVSDLQDRCYDAELLVPELDDILLKERCRRVNAWCLIHGKQNAICVSIHVNAYGNGVEWTEASGWSIYTSKGKTTADALADCIAEAAKKYLPNMKMRADWSDGDIDIEEDFYILRHTMCPAVLSENGFMTNEKECRWLQTREAKQAITDLHVEGIIEYLEQVGSVSCQNR
ncbi:MAG: N-acetylmuramoyl-L-alanine amidase [Bacteroidales bacterium]|nr:N-acetylmuramoyl-L-alanine amidase [Bacteroidales bacterium]